LFTITKQFSGVELKWCDCHQSANESIVIGCLRIFCAQKPNQAKSRLTFLQKKETSINVLYGRIRQDFQALLCKEGPQNEGDWSSQQPQPGRSAALAYTPTKGSKSDRYVACASSCNDEKKANT